MNKLKKLAIIAVTLLAISAVGYLLTRKATEVPTALVTPYPGGYLPKANIKLPTGDTFTVGGKEIKNIYNSAQNINDNGDAVFAQTESYQQVYILQAQYFIITVTGTPFESARQAAEQDFLKKLGISQEDACVLDVRVGTPYFANPNEAGKTYKLSFCEK